MIGSELSIPVITIIAGIIIITYLLIIFNQNITKARSVRVIKSGVLCYPNVGELPVIPNKECIKKSGDSVQCFQPNPSVDLVYEIGINPMFYRSICSILCSQTSTNGGCVNETNNYKSCIEALEPPKNCNSSANPLGRLTGTDDVYYANGIVSG